ncbi:hypothetical protein FKG94_20950 [Exilibacterium tricleocarpae]|uniref:Uncharacterized protein n=1 Tax=Exilibacterium tricleocarpae TaxID=2591008 RepID=A0A545T0R3_9GAMM|nr:hypothetical protein [Exilibacterium tricleocarpae]TQV70796.1 hypothetical protein FKG94_20950 [Exilibacterium tricleocarpae]
MQNLIAVIFLLLAAKASALEISDFKFGHMCGINKDDMGWVCFEAEKIYITGQSLCVSKNEVLKCTWYGFSFNYTGAKKGQKIRCNHTQSNPIYDINLDSASEKPSTIGSYTFTLEKEEGHFVNPQYSVLGTSGKSKPLKIEQKTHCISEGKKVFGYKFISIYPSSK